MAHVHGPCWVARLPKGISGPHGALCPPGQLALPLHSVLIVGCGTASFFLLDPFYTRDLQPLEVSDAELLDVISDFSCLVIEN